MSTLISGAPILLELPCGGQPHSTWGACGWHRMGAHGQWGQKWGLLLPWQSFRAVGAQESCQGRAVGHTDGSYIATVMELSRAELSCQPGGSTHPAALGEVSPRRAATTGCAEPCPGRAMPCRAGGVPRLRFPSAPRARPPGPTWARPGAGCGAAGGGRGRAIPCRIVPCRAGPCRCRCSGAPRGSLAAPRDVQHGRAVPGALRARAGLGNPGEVTAVGSGSGSGVSSVPPGSAPFHPGQLRPTRVSCVPNRLCPKSAPSHPAAGRGELWGGRGTVPGCLLARPRGAAGRRWGLSVISSSRIKPHASVAGHRAPCPAWHRGAVGCPGHSGGSGSLVPRPAPRAGGWGCLRGGCSCSITALPGAFSLFFRIQMTLEIEVVKHSCGSHRPVPGSTALFLGIFPARRVDPASLGGTGSCWRGILIPCPVQGSVSAGMNIPMRLVCQKLLDLGKTWEKKTKGEGRGCPSPKKKTQRVAPAMGKGPQPTCSA